MKGLFHKSTDHTTYVNKPCRDCGYLMLRVSSRTQCCKRCVSKQISARNRLRTGATKGNSNGEDPKLVMAVDCELSHPTHYWDI